MINITTVSGANEAPVNVTLHNIRSEEVFTMAAIIAKIGFADAFKNADADMLTAIQYEKPDKPRKQWTKREVEIDGEMNVKLQGFYGMFIGTIISNIATVKNDVITLLAQGTDSTTEFIKNLDADDFVDLLYAYIARDSFKDFFVRASKLAGAMKFL